MDQTLVHWMLGVFAFFVQVHRLQDRIHRKKHQWIELSRSRRSKGEEALWDNSGMNGRTEDTSSKCDSVAFEGRQRVFLLFHEAVDSEVPWKDTGAIIREVEDGCMIEGEVKTGAVETL